MPVQPDPTHPKFLEGDDVLRQPMAQEDDVEGHLRSFPVEEPSDEPEDLMLASNSGDDDVEGHRKSI